MLDLMLNQLNYIPQSWHVILVVWCIVTWLLLLVNSADINQIFFSLLIATETSYWLKFFTEAQIPAGDAAHYAVLFSDNRIQRGMLLDLNKEYLTDMGVSRLGDIIAILKHARTVHDQVKFWKFSSTTEQKHNNKKDLIKSSLLRNGYWSVMMMCIDTGQKSNFLLH